MSLKVFADLMSQPARAVTIFCRAANIQHELVNVRRIRSNLKLKNRKKYLRSESLPVTPRLRSTPR